MSGPEVTSPAIRHRITFATRRTLAYVSVLELGRIWERSLRRAAVPLKYSQGYNPRPKLNFAAPLPVGCGSEADLLDLLLETPWAAAAVAAALDGCLPPDLEVVEVSAVPESEPALAEQLQTVEYRVWLREIEAEAVQATVAEFLAAEAVMVPKRGRKHRGKLYDLRALVKDMRFEAPPHPWTATLWMHLNARPGATGRPDEVLKALSLDEVPRRCARVRMWLV